MNSTRKQIRGAPLINAIAEAARDKKAENITFLDVGRDSGIADWFVICEGDNTMHTRAIADNIAVELEKRGVVPWHAEGIRGQASGVWIVMDFSDVVVHVMTSQAKDYYRLEELWNVIDIKEVEKRNHE